ncbi:MAG: TetR/AcrR family transcriptional regulator [Pseudomonadota bacterium]
MARPREFNQEAVLDRITDLFWRKGYAGTSLDEIDQVSGLKRGSLYNAFGDKRQLYLAALDYYGQREMAAADAFLKAKGPAARAVPALFRAAISAASGEVGRRGCLLCNASIELAPQDHEVEQRVVMHLERLRTAFTDCLKGSTAPRLVSQHADHLTAAYMGLLVLIKAGCPQRQLQNVARDAAKLVAPE